MNIAVLGLGYAGLPVVRAAARAGMAVLGYDVAASVVAGLSAGRSHVDDVPDADIAELLAGGVRFTDVADELAGVDTMVICVPTPLDVDGRPDLSAVEAAARTVGRRLRPGGLVVLESTTYPGTTDDLVRPILEEASGLRAGEGFALAFSPERIDPGNPIYGLTNTPKVVGGYTPECALRAEEFYSRICEKVVRARGTREAEMAKLLENTYRQVNIAMVNEMAMFCHELDIDLWDVIGCAATKPFGFEAFYPGPGVGGHCIPIDPGYLSYRVRRLGYPFRFVELAQEVNRGMPGYVVQRVQDLLNRNRRSVAGTSIVLLGVTYKADVADSRESPATAVVRLLWRLGAIVTFHDPYVADFTVDGRAVPPVDEAELVGALGRADVTVLLQRHAAYSDDLLSHAGLLFDTRGGTRDRAGPVEGVEVL